MSQLTRLIALKPDIKGGTNIIAVVSKITIPLATQGKNHLCKIDLIDDSSNNITICMLFHEKAFLPQVQLMPHLAIIRLRRMKVQFFDGRSQLHKSPGFSYVVYHPHQAGYAPLDTSHAKAGVQLEHHEKVRIDELRDYLLSDRFTSTNFGSRFVPRNPTDLARHAANQNDVNNEEEQSASNVEDMDAADSNGNATENGGAEVSDTPDSRQVNEVRGVSTSLTTLIGVLPADVVAAQNDHQAIINRPKKKFNKFVDHPIKLHRLEMDLYCNIVVQVLGYCETDKNYVLRCLDGTKPNVNLLKLNSLFISSNFSQSVIAQLYEYVVDVYVYDEHIEAAKKCNIGDFISVSNLHCYTPYGMNQPELILHSGKFYGRDIKIVKEDSTLLHQIRTNINKIQVVEVPALTTKPLPTDEVRSLQSSPTECLYPQQNLTPLNEVLHNTDTDTKLYKVRVYIDGYSPDSYPAMFQYQCVNCRDITLNNAEPCDKCDKPGLTKILFFKLSVRDTSVASWVCVYCFGQFASDFIGVDNAEDLNYMRVSVLEEVMGKWCDLHVVSKKCGVDVKLSLSNTIIKPNLGFI